MTRITTRRYGSDNALTVFMLALAFTRVGGGAALLWATGAPPWALMGWLLCNVNVRVRKAGRTRQAPPSGSP